MRPAGFLRNIKPRVIFTIREIYSIFINKLFDFCRLFVPLTSSTMLWLVFFFVNSGGRNQVNDPLRHRMQNATQDHNNYISCLSWKTKVVDLTSPINDH